MSIANISSLVSLTLLARDIESVILPPITVTSVGKRFDFWFRPSTATQRGAVVRIFAATTVSFGAKVQDVFEEKELFFACFLTERPYVVVRLYLDGVVVFPSQVFCYFLEGCDSLVAYSKTTGTCNIYS